MRKLCQAQVRKTAEHSRRATPAAAVDHARITVAAGVVPSMATPSPVGVWPVGVCQLVSGLCLRTVKLRLSPPWPVYPLFESAEAWAGPCFAEQGPGLLSRDFPMLPSRALVGRELIGKVLQQLTALHVIAFCDLSFNIRSNANEFESRNCICGHHARCLLAVPGRRAKGPSRKSASGEVLRICQWGDRMLGTADKEREVKHIYGRA
jgi:hypothetical protein